MKTRLQLTEEAERQAIEWELRADTIGGLSEVVDDQGNIQPIHPTRGRKPQ